MDDTPFQFWGHAFQIPRKTTSTLGGKIIHNRGITLFMVLDHEKNTSTS